MEKNQHSANRPVFTPERIISLSPDEIFVFGSNLAGHHDGGAARIALEKFGAIYDIGVGLQGQSYAIPTMHGGVGDIAPYVDEFISFAEQNQDKFFYVTRIGCGIAGFKDKQIAPLFKEALALNNVCLPESFVRVLNGFIVPESYKIQEYGQVRTLADMVKVLNEMYHYTSLDELMEDFEMELKDYRQRGTITIETFQTIQSVFQEHEFSLFEKGKLNIPRLEELLNNQNLIFDKLESVFLKRSVAKILGIIQFLNDNKQYTAPKQILEDLEKLFEYPQDVLGDSYHYPLLFFKRGLNNLWNKITKNGVLNNDLLENYMFEQHDEKLELFGLVKVIEMDYKSDGPCHPEVYFPREAGTGPVYVDHGYRKYAKSCGEGKGPNKDSDDYEHFLLKIISNNKNNC